MEISNLDAILENSLKLLVALSASRGGEPTSLPRYLQFVGESVNICGQEALCKLFFLRAQLHLFSTGVGGYRYAQGEKKYINDPYLRIHVLPILNVFIWLFYIDFSQMEPSLPSQE